MALSCVAIWALTDFTADNGATRIVPGSHRFDRRPDKGEVPAAWDEAVMPAGSIVVYHGSTSGTAAGPTRASRGGWRSCRSTPLAGSARRRTSCSALLPEQVAEFPPRLRRMVGYGTYRGLLGHVDQTDPATWFDPDAATDMIWRKMR